MSPVSHLCLSHLSVADPCAGTPCGSNSVCRKVGPQQITCTCLGGYTSPTLTGRNCVGKNHACRLRFSFPPLRLPRWACNVLLLSAPCCTISYYYHARHPWGGFTIGVAGLPPSWDPVGTWASENGKIQQQRKMIRGQRKEGKVKAHIQVRLCNP